MAFVDRILGSCVNFLGVLACLGVFIGGVREGNNMLGGLVGACGSVASGGNLYLIASSRREGD